MTGVDALPEIALVQMDVKPARPDLNVDRMLHYIDRGREAGAELIVFSELCISGYILGDLWEVDALVEDFSAYSETIREASQDIVVLFGNVAVDRANIGEDGRIRKYNAVHVCADGRYVARENVPGGLPAGVQPKTLHPNYRFFDDDRHFYSLRKLADDRGRSVYDWTAPFEVRLRDGRTFPVRRATLRRYLVPGLWIRRTISWIRCASSTTAARRRCSICPRPPGRGRRT